MITMTSDAAGEEATVILGAILNSGISWLNSRGKLEG